MRTFHKFYFQIRQIVIKLTTEERTYEADTTPKFLYIVGKGKVIPLQSRCGPEGG